MITDSTPYDLAESLQQDADDCRLRRRVLCGLAAFWIALAGVMVAVFG